MNRTLQRTMPNGGKRCHGWPCWDQGAHNIRSPQGKEIVVDMVSTHSNGFVSGWSPAKRFTNVTMKNGKELYGCRSILWQPSEHPLNNQNILWDLHPSIFGKPKRNRMVHMFPNPSLFIINFAPRHLDWEGCFLPNLIRFRIDHGLRTGVDNIPHYEGQSAQVVQETKNTKTTWASNLLTLGPPGFNHRFPRKTNAVFEVS